VHLRSDCGRPRGGAGGIADRGKTAIVGQQDVQAKDAPARRVEITEGAKVEELVNGLQNMGATARDVISILQAIKAAGALDADLEVI